jgi:two-component system, NarL family, invasion response regulator UvrY
MYKRILIADDHSAVRSGIKHILSQEFSRVEFGEAINAPEVFKSLKLGEWDALILDVDLPGRSGLEILKQIRTEGMKIPVLMFSFHREDQLAVRALKAGASGYLSKDAADTELVMAINQILSGRKYVSSFVAQQLASQFSAEPTEASHSLLSDREFQIMLLIAGGKTVSQISDELSLSASTVSTYRSRVLEKMNMKNNAELMNYAIRQNMV